MQDVTYIDRGFVAERIGARRRDSHKGDYGRVLVVAGSYGMAGAAALCAGGALRSGAGLVRLCVPDEILPVVQTIVPEATCTAGLPAEDELDAYDAICIGPGLGRSERSRDQMTAILRGYSGKLVIDADGLNTIADSELFGELGESSCQAVITPHIGEARRLMGADMDELAGVDLRSRPGRIRLASTLAAKTWSTVLLKGAGTVITDGRGETMINTTGNPGMATGGSGDVLTGIICSLLGQGYGVAESAAMGAYIHGYAGDLAAGRWGEAGMTAGDLPEHTALAIREITEQTGD